MPHKANQTSFKKGHSFMKGGEKGWFKKGQKTWNMGTKGLTKANKTSFNSEKSKGNQYARGNPPNKTSFKKGQFAGEKHLKYKGGISKQKGYSTRRRKETQEIKAGRKRPEQCELCGIFGKDLKKELCFDHDHKTGKFRGWICGRCNTALGMVKDSSELLLKMSEYVK